MLLCTSMPAVGASSLYTADCQHRHDLLKFSRLSGKDCAQFRAKGHCNAFRSGASPCRFSDRHQVCHREAHRFCSDSKPPSPPPSAAALQLLKVTRRRDAARATLRPYRENLAEWWNRNATSTFAHIEYSGRILASEQNLTDQWEQRWMHAAPINPGASGVSTRLWRGATVVEYGIGGGLLGQYLLGTHNISRYIGIDIAERQLRAARHRLDTCCRGQYQLLRVDRSLSDDTLSTSAGSMDVFISQAVMQHFPDDEYSRQFLSVLSRARFPLLMLQVRQADRYSMQQFVGTTVAQSHYTTASFLDANLPNHRRLWRSEVYSNGYVYYWYGLRNRSLPPARRPARVR